jgi:hypothetical protein
MTQKNNFDSGDLTVPLVPKIPAIPLTKEYLSIPQQNLSSFNPITPKGDYPLISRIAKATTATNNTKTLYTVPIGKIFILTGVSMSVTCDAAAGSQAKLYGPDTGTEYLEFNSYAAASDAGIHQLNADFSTPFLFNAGEAIYVQSQSASLHATGMIRGYQLDQFNQKSQVKADEWLVFRGFLNIYK